MAAALALRGGGSAPAFGPEALTPDWENQEVSTGVRRESELKLLTQGKASCVGEGSVVLRDGEGFFGCWSGVVPFVVRGERWTERTILDPGV